MDFKHFVLYSFLSFGIQGYYHKSSFSTRDISQCKTIYMCPTFCWKLEKGCFICQCEASTTEYMTNAMEKMKDDYKPIKQTGSEYSLKQQQNGGSSTWSAISNSNMFPGMGSLSGVYSFGGSTSGIVNGGNSINNMKIMPQYNGLNKSPYTTSFQPSRMLPGQCPLMDYFCPSSCWFTDSMTGCIRCACAVGKTTPATNEPTSPPTTAGSVTTSDTSPTTQTATQLSTKQRQPNKTTRLLELMITTRDLPHPTITPYSNETTKASENNNGSGRYTSFVTKKTKKTTSGLKISGICLPIEGECPLHCLNYDHQTFCALCECHSTTTVSPKVKVSTSETTTTTPTAATTAKTCKPLSTSCSIDCRTYDKTTYCPVCKCQVTTAPSTEEGCLALSVDCPTKCVKLGENGCLICNCINTTSDSPTTDIFATNVLQCAPLPAECQEECITYDPKSFCPLCLCPTDSTKEFHPTNRSYE